MTKEEKQERTRRAREWRRFRDKYLLSQARLATSLGISRRCVIYVEQGAVKPRPVTLCLFERLKAKYEQKL